MDQILGWTATTLFSLAIVVQIFKILRTRTVDGVSAMLFLINLMGNIVALVYAILIGQPPLQVKYTIGIVISALGAWVYYSHKESI